MKKFLSAVALCLTTAVIFAQSPQSAAGSQGDELSGVIIIDTDELISVAPNPANDVIVLLIDPFPLYSVMTISNAAAVPVMQFTLSVNIIDISPLSSGLHYFTIVQKDGMPLGSGKFMVEDF